MISRMAKYVRAVSEVAEPRPKYAILFSEVAWA